MKADCAIAPPRPAASTLSILQRIGAALAKKRRLPHHEIEIRLRDLNQLFNSIDPSPFHEKDLDHDAEEFIVGWVQEFHRHDPVTLRIHVEEPPGGADPRRDVEKAVHNYFAYRAKLNRLDFKHMMKQGRMSLVIGLAFLTICIFVGNLISMWATEPWSLLLREALLIGGWVAMWRPMQTSVRLVAAAASGANFPENEPDERRAEVEQGCSQ
jgi:BMFP domain-containing protein YqiC